MNLNEEIEFLTLYAKLENKRFDKKFNFTIETDLTSKLEQLKFPGLLLQPLVENSIIHGVNSIESTGDIIIKFIENTTHLIVEIRDNGIGISKGPKDNNRKSHGISILKQRVKLYNGDQAMDSDITFKINDKDSDNQGTLVQIKLFKTKSYL